MKRNNGSPPLLLQCHEGILVTDSHSIIIRVNQAFTYLTGYSPEEVLGKQPFIFSSGLYEEDFYRKIRDSLKATGFWEGDIYNHRKNGDIYPEWLKISAIRDLNGKVRHYVACFNDLSKDQEAAAKIFQLAYYQQQMGSLICDS